MKSSREILGDHASDDWTDFDWACANAAVEAVQAESMSDIDELRIEARREEIAHQATGKLLGNALAERDKLKDDNQRLRGIIDSHVMLTSDDYAKLHRDRAENQRLRELVQEVIDHDETTGWGQNKLAAAIGQGEKVDPEPKQ